MHGVSHRGLPRVQDASGRTTFRSWREVPLRLFVRTSTGCIWENFQRKASPYGKLHMAFLRWGKTAFATKLSPGSFPEGWYLGAGTKSTLSKGRTSAPKSWKRCFQVTKTSFEALGLSIVFPRIRREPNINRHFAVDDATLRAPSRLWASFCIFALLGGCAVVPLPHFANVTPEFRGRITEGGAPLGGVPIKIAATTENSSCTGKNTIVQTNENGEFFVAPIRQFQLLLLVMGHASFPWSVCKKENGEWSALATDTTYSLADSGPIQTVTVTCDLGSEVRACSIEEHLSDGDS